MAKLLDRKSLVNGVVVALSASAIVWLIRRALESRPAAGSGGGAEATPGAAPLVTDDPFDNVLSV